ncbi:MAG: COX15/CtaA family protein [Phycisphaerales bacterium]
MTTIPPSAPPMPTGLPTRRSMFAPALVLGFQTAVAMWLVGFVTHLPGLRAAPAVVGLILLVVWACGSVLAGRAGGASLGVRLGATSSLITSFVNLLILGALLAEAPAPGGGSGVGDSLRPNWAVVIAGYFGFALVIGALGGWIGARLNPPGSPALHDTSAWLARFSKVAVAAAVPVIFSGGLVTSTRAGLAVPDWPNSFGSNMFLFPLSKMTGGIYYEHAHRLFGSLIGLTTLTLLVFTLRCDRRVLAKAAVIAVFVLVCVQGLLGGIGVTAANAHAPTTAEALAALPSPADVPADYATRTDTGTSRGMRMVHGILGQVTFAALCGVAAGLSRSWRREDDSPLPRSGALRFFTSAMLVTLVMQLGLGAAARHFEHTHAVYAHLGFAVFALTATAFAAFSAMKHNQRRAMKSLAHGMIHSTVLQVALGFAALLLVLPYDGKAREGWALVIATVHQMNGAALLGMAGALWAWSRRVTAAGAAAEG